MPARPTGSAVRRIRWSASASAASTCLAAALPSTRARRSARVGVSGDSSCADHNIAWRVRKALGLDKVPAGVSPNKDDGIIYDIAGGASKGGFGHPTCGGKEADVAKEIGAGAVVQ